MFLKILLTFFLITSSFTFPIKDKKNNIVKAFDYESNELFRQIELPVESITDRQTLTIFKKIDQTFSTKVTGLSEDDINLIKKSYLYLIFLEKLNKVKNNPKFKAYKKDFEEYFKDNGQPLPHIPSEKLIKSEGWKNVIITQEDLINSPSWQLFCKCMVSDVYTFFFTALKIIHEIESQIFNYIPHIETSFYDADYTSLRHINELTRIKALIETTMKDYYLQQTTDWSTLSELDPTDSKQDQLSTVEVAIVKFRTTKFYKLSHDIYQLLGIEDKDKETIDAHDMIHTKQLKSPIKESIWCFFMLKEVVTMLIGIIDKNNLNEILTTLSTSNLQPKLFPYSLSDSAYFTELISIKEKANGLHKDSNHPSPQLHNVEDTHIPIATSYHLSQKKVEAQIQSQPSEKDVVVQNIFSDIGHAVSNGFHATVHGIKDVGDGIEDAAYAVKNFALAAAQGSLGFGASIIGTIPGLESVAKFGSLEEKRSIANLQRTTSDLENTVNQLGSGLKDFESAETGVLSSIAGEIGSVVLDDKKLGEDMQTVMNQVTDTLVDLGTRITDETIQVQSNLDVAMIGAGMKFGTLVANSVVTIVTAGQAGSGNIWLNNAKGFLTTTTTGIAQTINGLIHAGKTLMSAIMKSLAIITNACSTIFIIISRDIAFFATTFLTGGVGLIALEALDKTNAGDIHNALQKYQHHTNNVLEAHRQTINQVMGVAIAIGFTIATAGAGSEASAGMIAAETAGEVTAETTGTAIVEGGGEAIAEEGGSTFAEEGGSTLAQNITEETEEGATDETGDAAKIAGEDGPKPTDEAGGKPTEKPSNINENKPDEEKLDQENEEKSKEQQDKQEIKKPTKLRRGMQIVGKVFEAAINVVFGAFSTISGLNGDDKNILSEEQQKKSLESEWKLINQYKKSIASQQNFYLQESKAKEQAAASNQALALSFLQNITFSQVNQAAIQVSKLISKQLIQMLTPSKTNGIMADIGSSWGIFSPYLNLYPTEGFWVATMGREQFPFSMEVAEEAYAGNKLTGNTSQKKGLTGKTKAPEKFCFNQKVTAVDNTDQSGRTKKPSDPLAVSIDFRLIYTVEGQFCAGIYMGGEFSDYRSEKYLSKLKEKDNFDLDYAHLAKMFLIFKPTEKSNLHVGIYEHEGAEWIVPGEELPESMQLDQQHIYHLRTRLIDDKLTVALWADNDKIHSWKKTVPVAKLKNNRTYGVISSGAAIEWNQFKPVVQNKINKNSRKKLTIKSEIEREKTYKKNITQAKKPQFGTMSLNIVSNQALTLGQYLYKTPDTDLIKFGTQFDYVTFGKISTNNKILNYGEIPSSNENVVISVITGKVYNDKGVVVAHAQDIWNDYKKNHGPFNSQLEAKVRELQMMVIKSIQKVKFGQFNLDGISKKALEERQFIYSTDQTIFANEQPITDYLSFVEIDHNNSIITIGLSPTDKKANGLVSFISGKLFNKSTKLLPKTNPKSIASGYSELLAYQNQFKPLSASDLAKITKSKNQYFNKQKDNHKKSASKNIKPKRINPVKIISKTESTSGAIHISLGNLPSGSISELQQSAAGRSGIQLVH